MTEPATLRSDAAGVLLACAAAVTKSFARAPDTATGARE